MVQFQVSFNKSPNKRRFGFLTKVIVMTLATLLSGMLLKPGVQIDSIWAALLASILIALLNAFLKPILIVLTLPFTLFSLGIFLLFINAFIVYVTASVIHGFDVKNFWWAMLFSIVITLISTLLEIPEKLLNRKKKKQLEEEEQKDENFFDDYEDMSDQ